jgi:hypothetical protein
MTDDGFSLINYRIKERDILMPKTLHGRFTVVTDSLGRKFKCSGSKDESDGKTLRYYSCLKVRLTNDRVINYSKVVDSRGEISTKCQGTMCRLYNLDGTLIRQVERRPHTVCHDGMVEATAGTTPSDIIEAATALMTISSDVEIVQKTAGPMAELVATAGKNVSTSITRVSSVWVCNFHYACNSSLGL